MSFVSRLAARFFSSGPAEINEAVKSLVEVRMPLVFPTGSLTLPVCRVKYPRIKSPSSARATVRIAIQQRACSSPNFPRSLLRFSSAFGYALSCTYLTKPSQIGPTTRRRRDSSLSQGENRPAHCSQYIYQYVGGCSIYQTVSDTIFYPDEKHIGGNSDIQQAFKDGSLNTFISPKASL